ncbi:MAG TPA: lamin tail domain-containing protein, partial [Jiangellaceae bacterium]|nr:lamin tail domain-containing protein [Jiangellaceae bacterium]
MLPIPSRFSRALITAVALSLLGSCLSVLLAAPASAAVAPLGLVVTEVAPDNTGNDDYEYFEVHNLSAAPVDLASGVSLAYVTTTLTVAGVVPGGSADTVLPPGATAVLWVSYTNATVNSHARTEKQFRDFWAAAAPAGNPTDYRLLRVTGQAGMANGGDRTLRVVDPSGLDISRSNYTAGSAGTNQTVQFRLPATGSLDLIEHQRLATPTPGTVAPEQLVQEISPGNPAVPDQGPAPADDPTLDAAQLQLTELVVDSTNVGTADGYEFVEIYNGANRAADFRDYTLQYLHSSDGQVNTAVVPWPSQPADPVVPPGQTLVFWIKNGQNEHLTAADFNAHYGADLVAGQDLVEVFSAGMANASGRGMEIRSNTGFTLNKGYYNVSGADDVDPDQGIQYAYDRANPRLQVLTGKATATPGYAAPAQVPGGLVVAPADTSPPAVTDLTDETTDPSADLAFQFRIDDDVRALTATLSIWNDVDGTPRRVNLVRSPADDYNYKLP